MTAASGRTALMLNELHLPTIKRLWPEFAERSDKEGWPAGRFLDGLLRTQVLSGRYVLSADAESGEACQCCGRRDQKCTVHDVLQVPANAGVANCGGKGTRSDTRCVCLGRPPRPLAMRWDKPAIQTFANFICSALAGAKPKVPASYGGTRITDRVQTAKGASSLPAMAKARDPASYRGVASNSRAAAFEAARR